MDFKPARTFDDNPTVYEDDRGPPGRPTLTERLETWDVVGRSLERAHLPKAKRAIFVSVLLKFEISVSRIVLAENETNLYTWSLLRFEKEEESDHLQKIWPVVVLETSASKYWGSSGCKLAG